MSKSNKEIVSEAKVSLSGKWGEAAMVTTIYLVISIVVSFILSFSPHMTVLTVFILAPLTLGYTKYCLDIKAGIFNEYPILFRWFKVFYIRAVLTYIMMTIYILLWTLLFIVPGIIKSFSYSQVMFILAEDDNITPSAALRKSEDLMRGYKMAYFLLNLRFIGWGFLSLLTLGIGSIWLVPYITTAQAGFYNDLKEGYTPCSEANNCSCC
ncbi:MAG: DUF975 family protein [Rikenellaceae bacterium]